MLGDKVKKLRKSLGITQSDLAKAISVSQSTIGMIEGNKQGTSSDTLIRLAKALNTTAEYLLSDSEEIENIKESKKERNYSLTVKEQVEIDDAAKKIIEDLTMSFSKNKDYLNEEDYFAIGSAIRSTLETIKIKNKKKFTPKKYR